MITEGELIETIVIGYEFIGIVSIVLIMKLIDVAGNKFGKKEMAEIDRALKSWLKELTVLQKLLGFILVATLWLPLGIIMIVKLNTYSD